MIQLHTVPTPNGHKVSILLEELEWPYEVIPKDILRGEQFSPEFLALNPNNKCPVIVDTEPDHGDEPIVVFESGAILIYLAEKSGRFLSTDPRTRYETLQWLMFQMSGVGPLQGQAHHFIRYASRRTTPASATGTRPSGSSGSSSTTWAGATTWPRSTASRTSPSGPGSARSA